MTPESVKSLLEGEWKVIAQSPFLFCGAVLVVAFLIWRALDWRYGGEIANLKEEVREKNRVIADAARNAEAALVQKPVLKSLIAKAAGEAAITRNAALVSVRDAIQRGNYAFRHPSHAAEVDAALHRMRAALITLGKACGTPRFPELAEPRVELRLAMNFCETILPYLAAGHDQEGRQAAEKFLESKRDILSSGGGR